MDKIDYLSCRCNIDFAENKDINFVSINYDDELEINIIDKKAKLKDTALYQNVSTLVGDVRKAKLAIISREVIIMAVINVFLVFIQSAFTFNGFLSFGTDYWKYMLFQATFLSTMIATFYNFFWSIFSRKKQLDYYGRISSTINSLRPQKCSFEDAKCCVSLILDNAYIYGDNDCFKKLPYKKQYLGMLKAAVLQNKKVSQYEYEYGKVLSSITNKGSLLFAIIGAILSVLVLVFTFLDTWSSVGNEFHTNMIATVILLTLAVPLITHYFISNYYYKRIMELESLYCLYSYQYLDMPYSEKTTSFSFNFSKYKELGPSFEKEFVLNFIKAFNESVFYKISIRDIRIDNNYQLSILGFSTNEINSNLFKEMVASVYEKMDILYRSYNHNC